MQAILTIILADLLAFFYADTIARKDKSSTYAFGGKVKLLTNEAVSKPVDVKPHQKNIHRQNFKAMVLVLALIAALAYCFTWSWQQGLIIFFNCGFIYWLWFDMKLAKLMGKGWWYLGFTANADTIIKGGKTKAIICGAVVVALHATYFLF